MTVEICLPVYNEEKILENNVRELLNYLQRRDFSFDWRVVLAINGTTDNSKSIAEKLARQNPQRVFVRAIETAGKGRAIEFCGRNCQSDIFAYMDIDLAVSLENIPDLLAPLLSHRADLVAGSRLLPGSVTERSYIRELSSRLYNILSKIILNHGYSDLQCGFKAIDAVIFKKIAPEIRDRKWFFDTELIMLARHFGFLIEEIPVKWSENRYEKRSSKINLIRDSLKFIYNLLRLKMRLFRFPQKI